MTTPRALSVETEQLPRSQVGLSIEVPQETVDATYERVLNRLVQRAKIEGFRPGRAPRPLVEARLGAAAIREEVIEALVPSVINQALIEKSIDAIDRPRVEVVEFDRGRPARLTAKVSVMPSVTLPDLSTLHVERQETAVDQEMVETRIRQLLDTQAEIEPVEREVRIGDVVVADLEVEVDGANVESERRSAAELTVAEGALRPEILAVLPGAGLGHTVVAESVLPEDHRNPDLRDRPARLVLTVRGVKEKRLPELTDELAAELSNGEQQTVGELRQSVRSQLEEQAATISRLSTEQSALEALVAAARVEVPESLVEREVEREAESLDRRLQRQGLRLERYLEYMQQTPEQWQESARPEAEARIKRDLVLDELARANDLVPGDAEVEASLREEAERDAEVQERLDELVASQAARDFFRHRLQHRRALEWLVERIAPAPTAPTPLIETTPTALAKEAQSEQ